MPYNAEPGQVAYVTFAKACVHGDLVAEEGFVGVAFKQQTPSAETGRWDRSKIAAGEQGILLIDRVCEAPAAGALSGVSKGALVYVDPSDNSLATEAAEGLLVAGKVASLPGERGTPADKVRINLRQKVSEGVVSES